MSTLRVRTSYSAIARSRAMVTFVLFVVMMCALAFGFWGFRATVANTTLRLLYALSAALPTIGILLAVLSLAVVIARRRKVILEVGPELHIVRSGVRLSSDRLRLAQTWTRDFGPAGVYSYLALIPDHVDAQMSFHPTKKTQSGAPIELDAYVAEFPYGASPNVFEVLELMKTEHPGLPVEKLGNI